MKNAEIFYTESKKVKPGGGNKPQPYLSAGNGERSGQYIKKECFLNPKFDCIIEDEVNKYNFLFSELVGKVKNIVTSGQGTSIPYEAEPFSVHKKIIRGLVITERYYNNEGLPYLDIDYTCHGNPETHPCVPHIHRWKRSKDGKKIERNEWERFI